MAKWTAQYIDDSWCFQVSVFFPILSSRRLSQLNLFFFMFLHVFLTRPAPILVIPECRKVWPDARSTALRAPSNGQNFVIRPPGSRRRTAGRIDP